jgi:hypothetical protein
MARRGMGLSREDFIKCKPGDTLKVIGGKYEGHLAILHSVKRRWVGVRVRRIKGLAPRSMEPPINAYISTTLPPHNLVPAPELDPALSTNSSGVPVPRASPVPPPSRPYPTVLRLASGPEVNQKVKILTQMISSLGIDHEDETFVNYTLDLLLLVRSDMIRMKEGRATVVQTLTRSLGTQHGGEWIDEESSEDEDPHYA